MLRYRLAVLLVLMFICCLGGGLPGWYIWFGMICVILAYMSLVDLATAVGIFLILNPLTLWMRNPAPDQLVLAGISSIALAILALGWVLQLLQGRMRFPRGYDIVALAMFSGWGLVMVVFSDEWVSALLGFRMIIYPCLFYVIARSLVLTLPASVQRLTWYALFSVSLLGVLQLMWYHGLIQVLVLEYEGTLAHVGGYRSILSTHVGRMTSIISGGSSNVGLLMGAGAGWAIAMMFQKNTSMGVRAVFLMAGVLLSYTSFLTLSRSVVVMILVGIILYVLSNDTSKTLKRLSIVFGAIILITVVFGTVFAGESVVYTIRQYSQMWIAAIPSGMSAIFGGGLSAPGGKLLGGQSPNLFVDAGWITIWAQMGIIGLALIISWLFFVFLGYVKLSRKWTRFVLKPDFRYRTIMAGIVALSLALGSTHTAIIMRFGSEMMFYAMAGITVSAAQLSVERWRLISRQSILFDRINETL